MKNILQKFNARLKFLYKQCSFLDEKLRESVCLTLVQCHLDYTCSSWYSGFSKNLKKNFRYVKIKLFDL